MAYKKSKKAPFDKNCVMEALHLRDCSIRKLDDAHGFGWSSKSVERGLIVEGNEFIKGYTIKIFL